MLLAGAALAVAPLQAAGERARFLEGASAQALTAEELSEQVKGYLPADAIAAAAASVPAPPQIDGAVDNADVEQVRQMNAHAKPERWERARQDDASVYDRFSQQLGVVPDRRRLPAFVRLLNRVADDALAAAGEAKTRYPRARPFQRFQLTRVCGKATAPKPEASPSGGTSYPSGHAAVSWAVALVMVEASPQSAQAIVARAVDYGASRVVCGLHFPSDIDAGHLLATSVIDKLFALPEFRRDFACAKRELQSVQAGLRAEDLPACL
jgi:acid phosphatase (class A)